MIESFRHKGLRLFYERNDRSKLPQEMIARIRVLLSAIDVAENIEDLRQPTFRLHQLVGDLHPYWSITVRANWRMIFRFEDGDVFDLDLIDYH